MTDAIPIPRELLSPPAPAPRVAQGHVDAVLVDLTRPESDRFRVRVYAEDFPPPKAHPFTVFVLYGASVPGVVQELRQGWSGAGIKIERETRSKWFVAFDLEGAIVKAVALVEKLARRFLP